MASFKKKQKITWKNGLGQTLRGTITDIFKKDGAFQVRRDGDSFARDVVRPSQIVNKLKRG